METHNLRLYSKSETAKLLGIGKEKLGKLLSSGRIGFIQIEDRIHIPYSEILNFIKKNTVWHAQNNDKTKGQQHIKTKSRNNNSSENQFDSINIFNKLLQDNINGKYLQ